MKRFMMFCSGLLLTFSMTGCCLLGQGCGGGACGPCGGGGYGAAYPYSGGGGGCPGGACGASASGYPSAFNGGAAYSQAAMIPGTQTALVEPIPTF